MAGPDPVQAVRDLLVPGTIHSLPFEPVAGDDVLPTTVEESMAAGVDAEVPLLADSTMHEFVFLGFMLAEAMTERSAGPGRGRRGS